MLNSFQIAFLLNIPRIGKKTVNKIEKNIKSSEVDVNELFEITLEIMKKDFQISKDFFVQKYYETEKLFENLESENVKVLNQTDKLFPPLLRNIEDPPLLLYMKGNAKCLIDYPTVAVIGTRHPSTYGFNIGKRVGEILTENNITVVSGLALGCDSAAHLGSVTKQGKTAAFLAHGLHTIYPSSNKKLAEDIIENGGCLVSEYAFGKDPEKYFYVERDRLQSGSSIATIVIESDIKGGTMHTVRFTKEQNKLLYCIDHPPEKFSKMSRGNQMLIKNGEATPINSPENLNELIEKVWQVFDPNKKIEIKTNDVKIQEQEKTDVKIKSLAINELAERFKLKSIDTIKRHLKKGDFVIWSSQRDPESLKWNYDKGKNTFYSEVESTLFDKQ